MKKITAILLMFALLFSLSISASAATINLDQTEDIRTMERAIPEGAFLFKEGLYIYEYTRDNFITGTTMTVWELYSADGWCFYDLQMAENYDEDGNLLPASDRVYAQYRVMPKNEAFVRDYIIPVPVEDGYEIVSVPNGSVTA